MIVDRKRLENQAVIKKVKTLNSFQVQKLGIKSPGITIGWKSPLKRRKQPTLKAAFCLEIQAVAQNLRRNSRSDTRTHISNKKMRKSIQENVRCLLHQSLS